LRVAGPTLQCNNHFSNDKAISKHAIDVFVHLQ
jgi:hypothetical protein